MFDPLTDEEEIQVPDSVRVAQTFLEQMYAGEFARAYEAFGPAMRAAVTDVQLADLRQFMGTRFGSAVRHSGTRTGKTLQGDVEIVYLQWDFERERIDARILVNQANQIIGLSFETPVIR